LNVSLFYSPSPEYLAAIRNETEIPPSGAAEMKGKVNRAEARQSGGGLGYDAIPLRYPAASCGELHLEKK